MHRLVAVVCALAPAPGIAATNSPTYTGPTVISSRSQAVLPPIISAEFGMDQPVYAPAPDAQFSPRVAFDGTNFFAVWLDHRWGVGDVYGARIALDGTVLDRGGIAIGNGSGGGHAIAFDGTNYLVVWSDALNVVTEGTYVARVSRDGNVLDKDGILVSSHPAAGQGAAVSFDGTNFLVVWVDGRDPGTASAVYGARVAKDGSVLDPAGIPIAAAASYQYGPSVSFNGENYLVVWADRRNGTFPDVYGARVGIDGVVLDPAGISIRSNARWKYVPAVSFDGTQHLVVWMEGVAVLGARVASYGNVLDADPLVISPNEGWTGGVSVAFDGTNHLVTWDGARGIQGTRVSTGGVVLDPAGIGFDPFSEMSTSSSIAFGGANHLVVGTGTSTTTAHVYGARVDTDGRVLDQGTVISTVANSQTLPAASFDGTNRLVVWQDSRGALPAVYGARIGPEGTLADPAGIAIAATGLTQRNPAIAFDGTNYLVVWEDGRNSTAAGTDIFGARVAADGTVLDPASIPISTVHYTPPYDQHLALAFNGRNYLVVWNHIQFPYTVLSGTRIGTDGVVLDPDPLVISATAHIAGASVSSDGRDYLVVWQDARNGDFDVYGARIAADGAVLDPNGFPIATGPNIQFSPVVSADGTNYLVLWQESGSSGGRIYRAQVGSDGTVRALRDLSISTTAGAGLSVAFDGTSHLVTWRDIRSGTQVFGARVGTCGAVLDSGGFAIAPITAPSFTLDRPSVVAFGPRAFLVAYDRLDMSPRSSNYRVFARNVVFDSLPVACALPVTVEENSSIDVPLFGSALSGNPLVYAIVEAPVHGTLVGIGSVRTYTPTHDYAGPDGFTFEVSDGTTTSAPFQVSIAVVSVNHAPVANPQTVTTNEDVPVSITLRASDVDGDALSFAVLTAPAHGTLTGTGGALTYTPFANFAGPDEFTFRVNDGSLDSGAAQVGITVIPVNDPPVALPQTVATAENTAVTITLAAMDVEGDALRFAVAGQPTHGTLAGAGAIVTYTPSPGFTGPDAFSFVANDGKADSAPGIVSIIVSTVTPVNNAPVALTQTIATVENTSVTITLAATDVDGDALAFAVVGQPAHGTLAGAGAILTYAPAPGFNGRDVFSFVANDGKADSAPAAVSILVSAAARPSTGGGCSSRKSGDDVPVLLLLVAIVIAAQRTPRSRQGLGAGR